MSKVNSLKLCRWAFRLILLVLACPVAFAGILLLRQLETVLFGLLFLLAALLLPAAELFFNWLNLLEIEEEKKEKK